MIVSKGMVQVLGTTYRIADKRGLHEVVRLLDDQSVGAFRLHPALKILGTHIEPSVFNEIVRESLRSAKLAWRPQATRRSVIARMRDGISHFRRLLALLRPVLARGSWPPVALQRPTPALATSSR